MRYLATSALMLGLAACSTPKLPTGSDAYSIIPAANPDQAAPEYRIGPLDTLKITVFREPDLSFDEISVDASGNILFPLIGSVRAAGRSSRDLSAEIAERLGERYLVNPQVSIVVSSSVSQKVTVEGAVTEPGVFELQGEATLLQALAMAKGTSRVAATNRVVIFRTINGVRSAAMFDLKKIRFGEAPDPQVLGNDTVVVDSSAGKTIVRDVLAAVPGIATLFVAINQNNN